MRRRAERRAAAGRELVKGEAAAARRACSRQRAPVKLSLVKLRPRLRSRCEARPAGRRPKAQSTRSSPSRGSPDEPGGDGEARPRRRDLGHYLLRPARRPSSVGCLR
jgi:hypothetical protein